MEDVQAAKTYRGAMVKLSMWNGPLDLLLDLIRESRMNIYDIPIHEITQQYLEAIRLMQKLDIEVASDFLVMASTLVWIKSRMLLPAELEDGEKEEWEDPRSDLVRQLLEYQTFKELATALENREAQASWWVERRDAIPTAETIVGEDGNIWKDISLADLLRVFSGVIRVMNFEEFGVLREEEYRIEDKMDLVREFLRREEKMKFQDLFSAAPRKAEVIATFWAVLELYKTYEIRILQETRFGEIFLFPLQLQKQNQGPIDDELLSIQGT